jgi:hypothetical protein
VKKGTKDGCGNWGQSKAVPPLGIVERCGAQEKQSRGLRKTLSRAKENAFEKTHLIKRVG